MSRALIKPGARLTWPSKTILSEKRVARGMCLQASSTPGKGFGVVASADDEDLSLGPYFSLFTFNEQHQDYFQTLLEVTKEANPWADFRLCKVISTEVSDYLSLDMGAYDRFSWRKEPTEILTHLESASTPDRQAAVLFAETVIFDETQKPRLLESLKEFVDTHRFSQEDDVVTVVGAAIRKFAMNMGESDFKSYATWLRPTETETLSHHVELELCKGILWRLIYAHIDFSVRELELINALDSLCADYLSNRIILQKNYAAIALNAILGIAILEAMKGESEKTTGVLRKVKRLQVSWFVEMLDRCLRQTATTINSVHPHVASHLRALQLCND